MSRRIGFATLSALFGLVVSVVAFGRAPGAIATQGQPVIAGVTNTETSETLFHNTPAGVTCTGDAFDDAGVVGCGFQGVYGEGPYGVYGKTQGSGAVKGVYGETAVASGNGVFGVNNATNGTGVSGLAGFGGTGVFGTHTGTTGIGVHGQTGGTGTGVFGQATANGAGVFGDSVSGPGVQARSATGPALNVLGKIQLSRSGTATIAGTAASPKSSVVVNNVALTNKSLILVTPQKNVAGTWVQAAVPNAANSRFTVFLNRNVSVSYPVAWMVIERP